MRKEVIVLFLLLLFSFMISGCSTPADVPAAQQEEIPSPDLMEPQQPEPEIPQAEEDPMVMEDGQLANLTEDQPAPDPIKEEEEGWSIVDPILTYEGAYNGPLYGTSEQIGGIPMDSYFTLLDRNGINFFIGMFAVFGEPEQDILVNSEGLGYVIDAVQDHPGRIIPFFNPGIGGEEIQDEGLLKELPGWYEGSLKASRELAGKDFIRGFGEVETQEWNVRHNDPTVMKLVRLADDHDIHFMFHPVASKISDVEKMIEAYPDTVFLIHMFREDLSRSMDRLIPILEEHDNLYYSIDAAHIVHIDGDVIYDLDSANKESSIKKFVSYYDSREKTIISKAIDAYKPLVEAVPEKVMWGTEIGPSYAFDPEVFDRAIKASRMVIGAFDEDVQEAVGYKNALRVFGEGVSLDKEISVIDTGSWPYCADSQIESCDEECGFSGEETPEGEACFLRCLISQKCVEELHMDLG